MPLRNFNIHTVTCYWCCYHGYRGKTSRASPHFPWSPQSPPLARWGASHHSQSGVKTVREHLRALGLLRDRCRPCGVGSQWEWERSLRRGPPPTGAPAKTLTPWVFLMLSSWLDAVPFASVLAVTVFLIACCLFLKCPSHPGAEITLTQLAGKGD